VSPTGIGLIIGVVIAAARCATSMFDPVELKSWSVPPGLD
jgi:hypothetical protein